MSRTLVRRPPKSLHAKKNFESIPGCDAKQNSPDSRVPLCGVMALLVRTSTLATSGFVCKLGFKQLRRGLKKQEPRLDVGMLKLACSVFITRASVFEAASHEAHHV